MTEQQDVRALFRESMEEANEKFKEVFTILWKGTDLGKEIASGKEKMYIAVPFGVEKTSWNEDILKFIARTWPRFQESVSSLTEGKLMLITHLLPSQSEIAGKEVTFQGIHYDTTKYKTMVFTFQLKLV